MKQGLSIRARNVLESLEIKSAASFRKQRITAQDLKRIRNCGQRTVDEIMAWAYPKGVTDEGLRYLNFKVQGVPIYTFKKLRETVRRLERLNDDASRTNVVLVQRIEELKKRPFRPLSICNTTVHTQRELEDVIRALQSTNLRISAENEELKRRVHELERIIPRE